MGKKIAIIFGVLVLALMVFMLTSQPSAPIKDASRPELKPAQQTQQKVVNEELNLQDSEEIKKIKQLQNSVANQPSEGVSKRYLTSCAPCHGANGKGVMAPSVAGKSKDEILASLKNYKEGKVPNSLMKGLLTNVSDEDLDSLADEISKFKE
ncbi:c-type cytochrome [Campylobacter rectus]|uniref:c-type cytochrome n=1 Tax=Campylobacter rectus TaxID=203 RepID=UPI000F5F47E3|nr:c-type cytochrome [Campylobacter rectus]RRD55136.1 cytochrome C [Campylobacter rectus]